MSPIPFVDEPDPGLRGCGREGHQLFGKASAKMASETDDLPGTVYKQNSIFPSTVKVDCQPHDRYSSADARDPADTATLSVRSGIWENRTKFLPGKLNDRVGKNRLAAAPKDGKEMFYEGLFGKHTAKEERIEHVILKTDRGPLLESNVLGICS